MSSSRSQGPPPNICDWIRPETRFHKCYIYRPVDNSEHDSEVEQKPRIDAIESDEELTSRLSDVTPEGEKGPSDSQLENEGCFLEHVVPDGQATQPKKRRSAEQSVITPMECSQSEEKGKNSPEKTNTDEIPIRKSARLSCSTKLTPEMKNLIDRALCTQPSQQVLVRGYRLQIQQQDMDTLKDLNWLNDKIVNFYLNMVMERGTQEGRPSVYVFNSFFYPKLVKEGHSSLKSWTSKVDIFAHDFLLIPVFLEAHWSLIVVCFKDKTMRYYDSLGRRNIKCLKLVCKYLNAESLEHTNCGIDFTDWTIENAKKIPQQMNSSDCGVFVCKYADYVTRSSKITFKQQDIPHFRRQMIYEILVKRLLN